jgi:hypothetical protein
MRVAEKLDWKGVITSGTIVLNIPYALMVFKDKILHLLRQYIDCFGSSWWHLAVSNSPNSEGVSLSFHRGRKISESLKHVHRMLYFNHAADAVHLYCYSNTRLTVRKARFLYWGVYYSFIEVFILFFLLIQISSEMRNSSHRYITSVMWLLDPLVHSQNSNTTDILCSV